MTSSSRSFRPHCGGLARGSCFSNDAGGAASAARLRALRDVRSERSASWEAVPVSSEAEATERRADRSGTSRLRDARSMLHPRLSCRDRDRRVGFGVTSPATIVYVDGRHLTLTRPGTGVHHRLDRRRATWPSYPYDAETSARVGYRASKRTGHEEQRTSCNRPIYRSGKDEDRHFIHFMVALRVDVARLFTRPCRQCRW